MGAGAMSDAFARELERQLGRLLHGGADPNTFRRWFASALWEAEGSADRDTLDLAYEIENIIAERSGAHISDAEMIDALSATTATRSASVAAAAGS